MYRKGVEFSTVLSTEGLGAVVARSPFHARLHATYSNEFVDVRSSFHTTHTHMARNAASNKVATGLMDIVQQAAIAFLQADTDGDQQLDFDEFKTVMPKHLQGTDDEIWQIFKMADADGSGAITQDEFFFWSIQVATDHGGMTGKGLDDLFKQFDSTGDGHLNSLEFRNAVEPFGFGAIAHDIFAELDEDGTGECVSSTRGRATPSHRHPPLVLSELVYLLHKLLSHGAAYGLQER